MDDDKEIEKLWSALSPAGQELVAQIIDIERSKIHMSNPRGVNEEIFAAVKKVIR